tara:strand:+ start:283 stop:438 length:156 start_codon:yes stop_codon:yes gene_type:complete
MRKFILKDKKAAKKLLKRAKKHPEWYTTDEVKYAKMVRKRIKKDETKAKEK